MKSNGHRRIASLPVFDTIFSKTKKQLVRYICCSLIIDLIIY